MDRGDQLMDHMMKFDELTMEMATLGDEINEEDMLVILLGSLPVDFEPIIRILENMPGMNLMSAKEILRREWVRMQSRESSEVALKATRGRIPKKKYQQRAQNTGEAFSGKCFKCGQRGHRKSECRTRIEQNHLSRQSGEDDHAFMAVSYVEKNNWLLDSGVTSHMCCQKSDFQSLRNLDAPVKISIADG
uniref:Putative polyprotein n=1 Tax=Albugo laibachii Nc14 TaxID=890382 RepID=F0X2T5_9STRA|nr:putative polyprotein [Albugo laibachii Nc14]|eukprot:CCA28238.1 putative polyprotein [Albugo laibachii Nc14]